MIDRYGEPPKSVLALLDVALLRAAAAKIGVSEITQKGSAVYFGLENMDLQRIAAVCSMKKYRSRLRVGAGSTPCIMLSLQPGEDLLTQCVELVDTLAGAGKETQQG